MSYSSRNEVPSHFNLQTIFEHPVTVTDARERAGDGSGRGGGGVQAGGRRVRRRARQWKRAQCARRAHPASRRRKGHAIRVPRPLPARLATYANCELIAGRLPERGSGNSNRGTFARANVAKFCAINNIFAHTPACRAGPTRQRAHGPELLPVSNWVETSAL